MMHTRKRHGTPVSPTRPGTSSVGAFVDDLAAMPRYREVAHVLMTEIASGVHSVGSVLPTEYELCQRFGISRFTAREALRQLSKAGLVVRKQRAGTKVIASESKRLFSPALRSIDDLLQYAASTDLRFLYTGKIEVDPIQARELQCEPGTPWVFAVGLRYTKNGGAPLCITRVYLNAALDGIAEALRERSGAIYELIETKYDRVVERVEQRILAAALSRDDAAHLQSEVGTPALRILRHYFDATGDLLEVSDSIHPGDRFAYSVTISRTDRI